MWITCTTTIKDIYVIDLKTVMIKIQGFNSSCSVNGSIFNNNCCHFKYFIDKLKCIGQQILYNNKMEQRQNSFTNLPKHIRPTIINSTIQFQSYINTVEYKHNEYCFKLRMGQYFTESINTYYLHVVYSQTCLM